MPPTPPRALPASHPLHKKPYNHFQAQYKQQFSPKLASRNNTKWFGPVTKVELVKGKKKKWTGIETWGVLKPK